jgi:myo-inositol-1(or 4)-monophosphatase
MKELLIKLSSSIRDAVRPWVLQARGGEIVGRAHSGDATFKIDEVAESCLTEFLRQSDTSMACFSEDKGLVMPRSGRPEWLLVVDPIDGSRNAKSGFEACMISLAVAKFHEDATLADVTHGLLHEIVGENIFYAERERSAEILAGSERKPPRLSQNREFELLRWSMTVPGRPASLIFASMADLIDASSIRGGFFSCNSTCYSISRIVTGQLDAYIDIANRIVRDFPATENKFRHIASGRLTGFSSYDIAAAHLIAKQAGVSITDGYGRPLDDMRIFDVSPENLRSCVAAANEELHRKLLEHIEEHIKRFQP